MPEIESYSMVVREKLHVLQFLTPTQVAMIDEALAAIGGYGEVRLVVENGSLRFLVTQKNQDALQWETDCLE